MISPFLKKLLFARQFSMIGGKIDILGKKQIMLPADVFFELGKINEKAAYKCVKQSVQNDLADYAKKLGSTDEGMLKVTEEMFETFGLGSMEILSLDNKRKKCLIRIHHPPVSGGSYSKEDSVLTSAVLAGIFSFLFSKDIDAKSPKVAKGVDYLECIIG